jgi:hypothetical protein
VIPTGRPEDIPESDFKRNSKWSYLALFFLLIVGALLLCLRPGEVPPLFFDEGWNLSAARNWIEIRHWGPLMSGKPIGGSMLSVGFPGILPLAASFRSFGYGLWQARLPGIFFAAGSLVLLIFIARRLAGLPVAVITLGVLLLMPANPELHTAVAGRMALGEMPAIFYILAGYACLMAALDGRAWLRFACVIFWGLAMVTKAQVIPFLMFGLAAPLLLAAYRRAWQMARSFAGLFAGSLVAFYAFTYIQVHAFNDPAPPQTHLANWSRSIVTMLPSLRLEILAIALIFALPTLLALANAAIKLVRSIDDPAWVGERRLLEVSLLFLSGSWYGWYVMLSNGLPRYLFPAVFFGSLFTAKMLWEWTSGFNFPQVGFSRKSLASLAAVGLMLWSGSITAFGLYRAYSSDAGNAVKEVLDYLHANTPSDAVIECGDAELHFLLRREYHYALTRHPISISLESKPDYVVIGHMSRICFLEPIVQIDKNYRKTKVINQYSIYKRNP